MAIQELPLLSESLVQCSTQVGNLQAGHRATDTELARVKSLHDMAKSKIRLLEEELEKSLQQSKDLEGGASEARKKYERLAGLV